MNIPKQSRTGMVQSIASIYLVAALVRDKRWGRALILYPPYSILILANFIFDINKF